MNLKINEAIALYNMTAPKELKLTKKKIAEALWKGQPPRSQVVLMNRLCTGQSKSLTPDQIRLFCEMTNCDPAALLGMKPFNK